MNSSSQIKDINIGIINLGVDFESYRSFCKGLLRDEGIVAIGNMLHSLTSTTAKELLVSNYAIAAASNVVLALTPKDNLDDKLNNYLKELQVTNELKIIEIYFSEKNPNYYERASLKSILDVNSFHRDFRKSPIYSQNEYREKQLFEEVSNALKNLHNKFIRRTGTEIAELRIKACKNLDLNYLDLSNLGLTRLPESIIEVSDFVEYVCIGNHQYFKSCESFDFSREGRFGLNNITDISVLNEFQYLSGLYCSRNKNLSGLEKWSIESLYNLRHLDLYGTSQVDISGLYNLRSLQMLDISYVPVKQNSFPAALNQSELIDFSAAGVPIKKIERFLNTIQAEKLIELNLSETGIKDLELISRFKNLKVLSLSANKLQKLEGLSRFVDLEELYLSMNYLTSLRELDELADAKTLINLRVLSLASNKLESIDFVSNFPNLETLIARNNEVTSLEPLIVLRGLRYLDVNFNRISKLDPCRELLLSGMNVGVEPEYQSLSIDGNPLVSPPIEVAQNGREKVLQYYTEVSKGLDLGLAAFKSNEVRILVLGNAFVGKSNLAHFIEHGFKDLPPTNEATHGIVDTSFKYIVNNKEVHVRMIDFGGQDYYHDLHHIYFSSDTIYFLLWTSSLDCYGWQEVKRFSKKDETEITDRFLSYPVSYWLDAIKYLQGQSENRKYESYSRYYAEPSNIEEDVLSDTLQGLSRNVILIQTKRSQNDHWYYNGIERGLYKELIFGSVSIDLYWEKESNKIIKKGVESLKENFIDLIEILTKTEWPGYYQALVNFFKSEEYQLNAYFRLVGKKRHELFSLEETIRVLNLILKRNSIRYDLDVQSALAVLDYLSNRGFVLSLPNQKYCLDPKSFSKKVYEFLPIELKGTTELPVMNSDFEEALCDLKVIAPHPTKEQRFIAPQLLPEAISSEHRFLIDHIKHTYLKYELDGFIHKSFLIDIFHAFNKENVSFDDKRLWKNGLVFKLKESQKDDVFYKIEFLVRDTFVIEVSTSQMAISYEDYKTIAALIESIIRPYNYKKLVRAKNTDFVNYKELSDCVAQKRIEVQGVTGVTRLGDIAPWWEERINLPLKRLFISYASPDTAFVKRLKTHLEPHKKRGIIDYWFDHMIEPGMKWDDEIKSQIDSSDVILWLVSPDFLASNYVRDVEIPRSIEIVESSGGTKEIVSLMIKHVSMDAEPRLSPRQFISSTESSRKEILIIDNPSNDKDWVYAIEKLFEKFKVKG